LFGPVDLKLRYTGFKPVDSDLLVLNWDFLALDSGLVGLDLLKDLDLS